MLELLQKRLIFIARCIDEHGQENLWPLLESVEKDIEALNNKQSALDRARKHAGSSITSQVKLVSRREAQSSVRFQDASLNSSHRRNAPAPLHA